MVVCIKENMIMMGRGKENDKKVIKNCAIITTVMIITEKKLQQNILES